MSVDVYSIGLCSASVCAPNAMSVGEVTVWLNQHHPTGIGSQWGLSDDKRFATGHPHPNPCNTHSGRTHYLFHC